MKGMQRCTHFKCDGCSNLKPIKEHTVVKAAYTNHNYKSEKEFTFNVRHIQLCNSCKKGK